MRIAIWYVPTSLLLRLLNSTDTLSSITLDSGGGISGLTLAIALPILFVVCAALPFLLRHVASRSHIHVTY